MDVSFRLHFLDRTVTVAAGSLTGTEENGTTLYRTEVDGVRIVWRFAPYAGGTLVTLEAEGDGPLGICRIDSLVFSVPAPAKDHRVAFLGRDMYANENRYPEELGTEQEYGECCAGIFPNLAGEGTLLAGVAPFCNVYASVVRKLADGSLEFSAKTGFTEGMVHAHALRTERVYWRGSVTIDDFFSAYRALLPQSSFAMPKLTGWNTWDYYLDRVTPEDIAENAAALKALPCAQLLQYIVIDDGWQQDWGDWRENGKFSCGLAAVAETIQSAGFVPGIWMAPLGVRKTASVFSEHPEWFCRDEKGELLWEFGMVYLDPTHPEAESFVLDYYRYQYACGYRLFKMDYVSPILRVKRFWDASATPYGALARFVRRVKECTGPDAVVLGCSLPLECGADIAPSMRIAVDIHNHFSHVVWIAQSLAWSWMFNNRTTRIDPDFLVVRGEETSDEPLIWEGGRNDFVPPPRNMQTDKDRFKSRWRHGDQFSAVEAETWANLVAISGGNIFLSDRISALNERGIAILQKALALAGEEVRPRYCREDARLPSVWQGDRALLLINWEDVPRTLSVSRVFLPFRAEKSYLLDGDTLTVSLRPHESFAAIYI